MWLNEDEKQLLRDDSPATIEIESDIKVRKCDSSLSDIQSLKTRKSS
jgi:hypothetical protein